MRVLGIGARVDLGSLYRSLLREGHEVRVHASDPAFEASFEGLVARVPDWREALDWVGRADSGTGGVVLFEKVGMGATQDALRAQGYRVIGGSALGDRLEYDRGFGQRTLEAAGVPTAPAHAFGSAEEAAHWLRANPAPMVLKHFDNARATFVGTHRSGADVLYELGRAPAGGKLLMPVLKGVEVGVGAYFDGERFLEPACVDFEHKRFFPGEAGGEMGEMTGEMGTLVSYRGAGTLMASTLGRLAPVFAAAGHVGYVNLNMIVNDEGAWPLELTCRFGNPGYAILAPLQAEGWGALFERMLTRAGGPMPTLDGWCAGIVLTIPPFPEERPGADRAQDPPVLFHTPMDDPAHYHFSDMRLDGDQLHAGRRTGYAMVVTGRGDTIEAAQAAAQARARTVCIPDLRYRIDIGERVRLGQLETLRRLGWFDR